MMHPLLLVIWLAPLVGAVLLWAFGPQLKGAAGPIASVLVGLGFVLALVGWNDALTLVPNAPVQGVDQPLADWLRPFTFGLIWDRITLVWTLIITGVGCLIHIYSIGYMAGDKAVARFFAYMNFFVFAMLTLVLSDNFVGLLIGWGLVGLASYLLIGFYFDRPSAVAAARKAFVINVVGDVGILYAIFVLVSAVGGTSYADVFAHVGQLSPHLLFVVCLGLFVGCAAKSAQLPLHSWLPDAMEGPTPVSALIHAATMVTAGVYLIARCWPLWIASADARVLVGSIGALTALAGAILGCVQWDIKRILAYSTMSQIGYMIMGVGVGAFSAGILHFLTHACFKALLFLGSGIIIHALDNEQDVRRMGGLRKRMPFAFAAILVGVLSISGVPGFAGFFSKDAILGDTLARGYPVLWAIGVLTAGITAYYMFRLLFITFFGDFRFGVDPSELGLHEPQAHASQSAGHHPEEEEPHHGHATAWSMTIPVAILMIPSVLIGWLDFGGDASPWGRFFAPVFPAEIATTSSPPDWITSAIVLVLIIAGFAIAYVRYAAPAALSEAVARLRDEALRVPAVLAQAYFVDTAIGALIVRPSFVIGTFFARIVDPLVIDAGVREASISAGWLGHLFRSFETGLVRAYALAIAFGVACFAVYYVAIGVGR